jgi:hypothetical protein
MAETVQTHGNARLQLPARTAGPLSIRPVRPRAQATAPDERRKPGARDALLRRIAVEYDEMPGLQLTLAQARRLFGLRDDICIRVLNTLVEAHRLRMDVRGAYARSRSES